MDLPLQKIVAVIIFLVILAVLLFFAEVPKVFGTEINLQQELRKCCQAYISHGCPDLFPAIRCNSKSLPDLVSELGLSVEQTKEFCNCP